MFRHLSNLSKSNYGQQARDQGKISNYLERKVLVIPQGQQIWVLIVYAIYVGIASSKYVHFIYDIVNLKYDG